MSPDAAAEWRRICLDRQLPHARFPAGVKIPGLMSFWCLLLVAGLCLLVLGGSGGREVPDAVVDSQKQLVGRLAGTQRAVINAGVEGLRKSAEKYGPAAVNDPDRLLAAVVVTGGRWKGAAILDDKRQPVAARGEALPPDSALKAVPGAAVPVAVGTALSVVVAAVLPNGRVLAAVAGIDLRVLRLNTDAQQSVFIAGPGNTTYSAQGVQIAPENQPLVTLIQKALLKADTGPAHITGSLVTLTDPQTQQTRRLAPVVTAAPIGESGLSVVSVTHAARVVDGQRGRGLEPGLALAVVALLVLAVLYFALIRPIIRVLGQAKAMACGETPDRVALPVLREAARISAALAEIANGPRRPPRTLAEQARRRRPAGVSALAIVALCAVAVLGWCAAVAGRYAGGADSVPAQVSVDARNDVEGAAVALRDGLTAGVTRLRQAATAAATAAAATPTPSVPAQANGTRVGTAPATGVTAIDPEQFRSPFGELIDSGDIRSAYVVDKAGKPVLVVGEDPARQPAAPPAGTGVKLDRVTGPVPVVYAYLQVADGQTVIAEYGVRYLSGLLRRAEGRVRVVDADLRTILDTGGYVPFRVPAVAPVRDAATAALNNNSGTSIGTSQGSRMLLTGTLIGGEEDLPDVRWAVVSERSLAAFRLPQNDLNRGTWLVAFLALVVAVLLFAWYRLVVIRPLRQMAEAAERLADGDVRDTVCPVRHDEIGAIAVCLDIIRQTMSEGTTRLAGAARLKGIGREITMVLPIVRPKRADGPGSRRASKRGR
jgi:HAMP domain-containing protein